MQEQHKLQFSDKEQKDTQKDNFASSCKPLNELLDSVRHIEGFPIAKDENIIALSLPPYYTACPNPYINEFIKKFGNTYRQETDNYERLPFVGDVSEGKMDPIYNAHMYHTKVPYKAIMQYIEHYTDEGNIVLDGFCGSGMTGIAANMLKRKAILIDLAPAATFLTSNYNVKNNLENFESEAQRILFEVQNECGWMYETLHTDGKTKGQINYTVWSDVFICPYCKNEYALWDAVKNKGEDDIKGHYNCPNCKANIKKSECAHVTIKLFDKSIGHEVTQAKQIPVLINYTYGKKRAEKTPDKFDLDVINKIESNSIPYWHPINELPDGYNTEQPKRSHGITNVHHFYTKRNLWILSALRAKVNKSSCPRELHYWLNSIDHGISKRVKHGDWSFPMSVLSGTLYIPSLSRENNPLYFYDSKYKKQVKALALLNVLENIISTQSLTKTNIINNSIDSLLSKIKIFNDFDSSFITHLS